MSGQTLCKRNLVTTPAPPADPEKANPYCLALTGGIACGKSTVGLLLQRCGLHRVDSDQVARQVVAPGSPGLERVVARFGSEVLLPDGAMDRRAVGRLVFASSSARRDLEKILHPLIWGVMAAEIRDAGSARRETVFEIPLLYENGNAGRFTTVWVVAASKEVQIQRLQVRDSLTVVEAQARLDSQMSVDEKARRADYVLLNDGDTVALEEQVDRGLSAWRGLRR